MRSFAIAIILTAGCAWGAGFVSWQPAYELWMPSIYSSVDYQKPMGQKSAELPFEAPKLLLAPPLPYKTLAMNPLAEMILRQEYFAQGAANLEAEAALLTVKDKIIALPKNFSASSWPSELILLKYPTSVAVLATWPAGVTLEARQNMEKALTEIVAAWPEGTYNGKIVLGGAE